MRKIIFLIFVLFAAISWAAYGYLTGGGTESLPGLLTSPLSVLGLEAENKGTSKNIMVMGVDSRPKEDDPGRSDTLFVLLMDKHDDDVVMISVPRDTRVRMKGLGWDKINHAYSFGGQPLTRTAVEHLLGLRVDNYISVDFNGFKGLVDAVGGVDLEVEKRMYYYDTWDGFTIDLAPGMQHMDGDTAIQYVRYRDEEGDLGRVRRQQHFVSAMYQKIASPAIIPRIPALISQLYKMVETDLSFTEMADVGANVVYRLKHKKQEADKAAKAEGKTGVTGVDGAKTGSAKLAGKAPDGEATKAGNSTTDGADTQSDADKDKDPYADEFITNSLGFKAAMVPGTPKYVDEISYWIPNVRRLRRMMASVLGDQEVPEDLRDGTAELELQYERAMVDPLREEMTSAELRGDYAPRSYRSSSSDKKETTVKLKKVRKPGSKGGATQARDRDAGGAEDGRDGYKADADDETAASSERSTVKPAPDRNMSKPPVIRKPAPKPKKPVVRQGDRVVK